MNTVSVPTFTATIYVGTYDKALGLHQHTEEINKMCQEYVDKVGLCVTVTKTDFCYTDGHEGGAAIGLINYPRFPMEPNQIRKHALALAEILKEGMRQERVSVVFPNETIMIGPK